MSTAIIPAKLLSDYVPRKVKAVASLVVNRGQFFILDLTTGRVDQALAAAANSAAGTKPSHFAIEGLNAGAAYAADDELVLHEIQPGDEFEISLTNDDAVVAWNSNKAGDVLDLRRPTGSNVYVLNTNSVAQPVMKVAQSVPGAESDTDARVNAVILAGRVGMVNS